MTNVIERLGKYAGLDFDKQRTPSNPCITVREAIEVANHIATLTAKLAESQAEIAHWKNNHATEVRRARILKERTDMPIERVQAYEKWGDDQQQLAEAQRDADELKQLLRMITPTLPVKQQAIINDSLVAMARSAE